MDKTEKRICWYSSLLIALLMSGPRFLALRENGIVARYWHFNFAELLFQVCFMLGYCYLMFNLNLKPGGTFSVYRDKKQYFLYVLYNVLLMLGCCLIGGIIQRHLFTDEQLRGLYWSGYFTRSLLSALLTGIIIKIILLIRESKIKEQENAQLKTAYLEAELELLKEQLNPHFLFNSLSSLSGIIREDPAKAQHFIGHLSKIFRYALTQSGTHLVTLEEELAMIKSYGELLTMRFEKAFQLDLTISDIHQGLRLPHLSLQPLLENAAKHNSATLAKPLTVKISMEDNWLVVSNNLQQIARPENSTGIGLANLNSRFRILMHREIEIVKTADCFSVKLPLST